MKTMKAYEIYLQIYEKAEEVREALSAILATRGCKDLRWSSNDLIDFLSRDSRLVIETEFEKDSRRHVKVLYADYCGLRDELVMLLEKLWLAP